MSAMIVYEVADLELGREIGVVKGPKAVTGLKYAYGLTRTPEEASERDGEALLAFKDQVTELLPNEQALIFITKEQAEAMGDDFSEKEKHGES